MNIDFPLAMVGSLRSLFKGLVWRAGLLFLDLDIIDALGFLYVAMRNQMTSFRYCSYTCKVI